MAESVDALVSNTSGAIHPGSSPGLGTLQEKEVAEYQLDTVASFLFVGTLQEHFGKYLFSDSNKRIINAFPCDWCLGLV